MHTNDTHAHVETAAKRVTAVKEVRADNPDALLIDAGDVFSGTLFFNKFNGLADLEFMNLMQYDMMTFGNHEFDKGAGENGNELLADFVKKAEFPFVSSNVNFSKDSNFDSLVDNSKVSRNAEDGKIYNAIIKEVNGEEIGFFGLTTEETADIASPGSVSFENYIEKAEETVAALEAEGIDKIVAVSHLGYDDNAAYDNDLILAAEVDGIDVIVGGHSHTTLTEPTVITEDADGNEKEPTLIVQAYQYGDYLGVLDVEFDENGTVASHDGRLLKVADYKEDQEAAAIYEKYASEVDELKNTSTGATAVKELTNPRDGGDKTKPSVRKNETELGNILTDSMLATAKKYNSNTVIAMQNGGGIRAGIDQGDITLGDVLTVLPFGNTLATMDLTGAEIKEALEHSVSQYPSESGAFLHISGMKYTFDSTKAAGSRVQSVQVYENGSYTDLVEDKVYTIATNAFTAKGGDGYTVFQNAYEDNRVTDYGLVDWETFADYLAELKTIDPVIEGRVKDIAGQTEDEEDTEEEVTALQIHDIQGASHTSPYVDQEVEGIVGVVTYVESTSKFYVQGLEDDGDDRTSEAIQIYKKSHGANVGDLVSIIGTVKEYVSSSRTNDLKTTQIEATAIKTTGTNHELPAPVVLDVDRKIPTEIIDNDSFSEFDPEEDGIDFYESLEGMLVQVNNPKIVGPQAYGDLVVVPETIETTNDFGGLNISENDYNPERITLNLNNKNLVADGGDKINGNVSGVISYDYGNYVVNTKSADLPEIIKSGKTVSEDVTTINRAEDKLSVATYNIENFSFGDARTTDIAKVIVNNLKSPDIVQLTEVQDDSGETDDGVTNADKTYQSIIDAIAALGGPMYAYTEVAPLDNQDGGAPGGNIRVGIIYNTERVTMTEGLPAGTATEAVGFENGSLTMNPGRIDPANEAFDKSRKPLAAQFEFNGEKVVVIASHYNSKGGDLGLFGNVQPATLTSEIQRVKIATVVNNFVKEIMADDPDANVIVLGDFNDFQFSKALKVTAGNELTNMIDRVAEADRFTYNYQGNAQVLDHILVSNRMAAETEVDIIHLNSPFFNQISDHDPVLIQTAIN